MKNVRRSMSAVSRSTNAEVSSKIDTSRLWCDRSTTRSSGIVFWTSASPRARSVLNTSDSREFGGIAECKDERRRDEEPEEKWQVDSRAICVSMMFRESF